jgi:hypothetical protein
MVMDESGVLLDMRVGPGVRLFSVTLPAASTYYISLQVCGSVTLLLQVHAFTLVNIQQGESRLLKMTLTLMRVSPVAGFRMLAKWGGMPCGFGSKYQNSTY